VDIYWSRDREAETDSKKSERPLMNTALRAETGVLFGSIIAMNTTVIIIFIPRYRIF